MISASISRSRHTVKPKPPSGGLRVGGSQRTDEASQMENVMEKFEYTQRFTKLLTEAGVLADRINLARFEETVPDADHTIRLCDILDIALCLLTEGDAIQKEAQTLAEKYGIEWDDNSFYENRDYHHLHNIHCPEWLKKDPLENGHHSCNWYQTLWLVQFYAKHHPDHPDHENREYLLFAPHCMRKQDMGFDEFQAEWSNDLGGYIITFNDGRVAQTQINIETNKLHADYGLEYLERYTEYDDELSDDQSDLVDSFVKLINKGEAQ